MCACIVFVEEGVLLVKRRPEGLDHVLRQEGIDDKPRSEETGLAL